MKTENEMIEKAKNWNFSIEKLSAVDKEYCLRQFHGDCFAELDDEDKLGTAAIAFLELNALIANGLLKKGEETYIMSNNLEKKLLTVFTHKEIKVSEDIIEHYLDVNGESEYDMVQRDENADIQAILSKYIFW